MPIQVDCDFPGGNILVDRMEGNLIEVHQDLGDTTQDWFYWCFRLRGAAGQVVRVRFTASDPIGRRGPAASLDGGQTWRWLGTEWAQGQEFTFAVPPENEEARFSLGMPYMQADLERFLAKHAGNPALRKEILCASRKGRPVEALFLGREAEDARFHILLTCRHHCCEMMASYSLEGIMECILGETEQGGWLREKAAFLVVPFVDKDGVEDGDQGKLRAPHDHNRDYAGESIYPEVAAIRRVAPRWCGGKLDVALDLHCPWIRGGRNETVYFVGEDDPPGWEETKRFGAILERTRRGPLPYICEDNLPFGLEWNTGSEPGRKSASEWARETFPSLRLGCCLEIPYANARGAEVNAESARLLGQDLARALAEYWQRTAVGMEGEFFEMDVHTLQTKLLFDLNQDFHLGGRGVIHFKAGYSCFGRAVLASNSYTEQDFLGQQAFGRLLEWDGENWTVLERKPFVEVTGHGNFMNAIFATGWDRASAILKVFTRGDGQWTTYRLPKASHTFDHAWQTEWPRIRQTEHERFLMDCHGMFYELSPWAYGNRVWGIRPISTSTHLWVLGDFCTYWGMLVLGPDNASPANGENALAGEPQSGLWFGKTDDLWSFGKPAGWGGPWWEEPVKGGLPSDPYLMTGFDKKALHLSHEAGKFVHFKVEVDFLGAGKWKTYDVFSVPSGGYVHHEFPQGFSAHWVRVTADVDCIATAYFTYT